MLYRLVRPMRRKDSRSVYFQQRIPADVKQAAIGRRFLEFQVAEKGVRIEVTARTVHIKFSLRTSDPAKVKLRQAEATRQAELHWKALRQTKAVTLSHRQCVAFAGRAYQAWASRDRRETTTAMVRVPVGALKPGEAAKKWQWEPAESHTIDGEPEVWAAAAAKLDPERLGALADRLLLAEGINGLHGLDAESREMLLDEIAKALRQAFEHRKRNAESDYRPDPMADRFPSVDAFREQQQNLEGPGRRSRSDGSSTRSSSPSPTKVSLMGLVEDWWREAKATGRKPSTYESYRNSMATFVAFLKHDDAGRVTPDDILRFKDHRLDAINPRTKKPVSAKTVKDSDLAGLKTVFGWAVSNRRLASNPAEGITLKVGKRVKLRSDSLTDEEAKAILSASLSLQRGREATKTFEAKRWVPWLAAYTGARVGELAQLRKQDVTREPLREGEHCWIIRLTPEAGTIKTNEARTIVLHPHLVELGFPAFVQSAPTGHLFLNVRRKGVLGPLQALKNRLGEFVRTVIKDPNVKPMHGFRHRFKTIGIEAGMPMRVLDAIQGHAPRTAGEAYGEVTVKAMADAMERLPRIEALPRVRAPR